MLCNKSGIHELKYMMHSDETLFRKRSDQESLNKRQEGNLGKKETYANHFQKAEKRFNMEPKSLNIQNNMIYSMTKSTSSRKYLNNTKNV